MIRDLSDWLWPKPLLYKIQTVSLIGPRQENQDNYLVIAKNADEQVTAQWLNNSIPTEIPRSKWSTRWVRLAIMDGIGGHQNGREIAEAAATQLQAIPPCTTLRKQQRAVLKLHRNLQKQFADGQIRSPGTTLVWAEIDRYRHLCHLTHLGDSRAWLWNGVEWKRLTLDQTNLEFNFRDGRVDSITYLTQRDRSHSIAQALGYGSWGVRTDESGQEVFGLDSELRIDTPVSLPSFAQNHADSYTLKLMPGMLLLLASDGLWNTGQISLPHPDTIHPNTARELANAAMTAGSRDNTTVVIGMF